MQDIIDYYRKRDDVKVDDLDEEVVIWQLYWGELHGVDAHRHMGIARISKEGSNFVVGWLRDSDPNVYKLDHYVSKAEVCLAIDKEIETRDFAR